MTKLLATGQRTHEFDRVPLTSTTTSFPFSSFSGSPRADQPLAMMALTPAFSTARMMARVVSLGLGTTMDPNYHDIWGGWRVSHKIKHQIDFEARVPLNPTYPDVDEWLLIVLGFLHESIEFFGRTPFLVRLFQIPVPGDEDVIPERLPRGKRKDDRQ